MRKIYTILFLLAISSLSFGQNIENVQFFSRDFNTEQQDTIFQKLGAAENHLGIDVASGHYEMTTEVAGTEIGLAVDKDFLANARGKGKLVDMEAEIQVKMDPFKDTGTDFKFRFFGPNGFVEVVLNSFGDMRVWHRNNAADMEGNIVENTNIGYEDGQKLTITFMFDAVADELTIKYGIDGAETTFFSGKGKGDGFGDFYSNQTDAIMFKWGEGGNATAYIDNWEMSGSIDRDVVEYTLRFDSDGGSRVDDIVVTQGSTATAPAPPEKPGFTFQGWYVDDAPFDWNKPITSDLNLVAKWKLNGLPDFAENFEDENLDPRWRELGDATNYLGIENGVYYFSTLTSGENISLRRYTGKPEASINGFVAEVHLIFDPFANTTSDFKWKIEGPNGFTELVLNSFSDMRVWHRNNAADMEGNIVENTNIGYEDGQTLKINFIFDAVADTLTIKYGINGTDTTIFSGKGKGDGFGDFYTNFLEFNMFKWGDGEVPLTTGIDYASLTFEYNPTSIKKPASEGLNVYPNPASSFVNIEGFVSGTKVAIYDLSGKLQSKLVITDKTTLVDVSKFVPGIYFIKFEDVNGTKTSRFIKK